MISSNPWTNSLERDKEVTIQFMICSQKQDGELLYLEAEEFPSNLERYGDHLSS